ncbi:lysophospholipid acyltransferase family protein [Candidatus Reidiella endopervernicosa]|uniref:Lysophospholipid acyltransferase family protein n=1 Tax=Candidatus Reidiella endopervernicosa TaxID=2738883 RepID=A0A6N0HSI2_9GAMM|nr:lysophospholipid acyltransferase family protein [Candidatus Reidiella endopervernicosa]QKQ25246.1 lysophospholipid acyltransferase family protein [Candidatus Reidiella endopervernicosa]
MALVSERALKTLVEVEGESILNAAVERGKGIILALPHLGCWEMVGLYGADRMPMTSLYRPLRLGGLDQLVRSGRERNGATLVPTDASGIRSLYQALKRGELIAILPDQGARRWR